MFLCRLILNIFKETLFQFHRNLYAFLMSYVSAVDDYITPRKEELTYLSPGGDLGTVLEEVRYNHIHCTYVCVYVLLCITCGYLRKCMKCLLSLYPFTYTYFYILCRLWSSL